MSFLQPFLRLTTLDLNLIPSQPMLSTLRLSYLPFPRSLAVDGACPSEQVFSQLNLTFPNSRGSFLTPLSCSPEVYRRRRYPLTMSTYDRPSSVPANQFEVTELNDESDFETLLSHDGRFSVCGFGSLLSGKCSRLRLRC